MKPNRPPKGLPVFRDIAERERMPAPAHRLIDEST